MSTGPNPTGRGHHCYCHRTFQHKQCRTTTQGEHSLDQVGVATLCGCTEHMRSNHVMLRTNVPAMIPYSRVVCAADFGDASVGGHHQDGCHVILKRPASTQYTTQGVHAQAQIQWVRRCADSQICQTC